MESILAWVTATISAHGYAAITLLMAIESANIPVPSELIMPFGGFLVFSNPGMYSVLGMALAGAVGELIGSSTSYWLGARGGRPFVEKYGKYLLIHKRDIAKADGWFQKYGDWAAFIGRLLPIVRTFISFPAGISRVNFPRFVVFTFIGSMIWCTMLAYVGMRLGEHWESIRNYFHGADVFIGAAILLGLAFHIYRHVKGVKEEAEEA